MRQRVSTAVALGLVGLPSLAGASIIDQYEFGTATGGQSTQAVYFSDPNVTATALARGSGWTTSGVNNSDSFSNYPTAGTYSTTLANAFSAHQYDFFTITPNAGATVSLSQISYGFFDQNGAGGASYSNNSISTGVAYSVNGGSFTNLDGSVYGSNNYPSPNNGSSGSPITEILNLSGQATLQNDTGPIVIEITYYNMGGYTWSGLGRIGDDVELDGTSTSAAPEPSSLTCLFLGIGAILTRRRRGSNRLPGRPKENAQ